jgi:hypothetical protein
MTDQKINKSDYTDRKGVVHPSIGENIRSDNNQLSSDYLNNMSEDERASFPFFPFKKGKWEKAIDIITDRKHTLNKYFIDGSDRALEVDPRVKYAILADTTAETLASGVLTVVPIMSINVTRIFFAATTDIDGKDEGETNTLYLYVEDE